MPLANAICRPPTPPRAVAEMASAVASTRLAGPSNPHLTCAPRRRRDARHKRSMQAGAAAVDAEAPGPSGSETPAAAAAAHYFLPPGASTLLDWDPAGHTRFAALQSPAGRHLLAAASCAPDDVSSIVHLDCKVLQRAAGWLAAAGLPPLLGGEL